MVIWVDGQNEHRLGSNENVLNNFGQIDEGVFFTPRKMTFHETAVIFVSKCTDTT